MVPSGRERKGLVKEPGRAAKEEPCNTAVPAPPPLPPGTPPPLKPTVDSEENPTPPPTSMKAPGASTFAPPTGGPYEAVAEASWQMPVAGVRLPCGGETSHNPRPMPAVGIDDALDSAIPGVPG